MKFKYSVPVIVQDLPPTEALHQTFDHLKHLDEIMNDAFNRISTRIKAERSRISSVNERVAIAQAKVKSISENQSRVTTVYSSAKYLAPKVLPDFQRVCDSCETDAQQLAAAAPSTTNVLTLSVTSTTPTSTSLSDSYATRAVYRLTAAQRKHESAPVDITDLFTYLSQARANRGESEAEARELDNGQEGLGRLPAYLPSISSVLLFNSEENPYKKYVSINNLEGVGGKDKVELQSELAAAPQTIIRGEGLPAFAGLDYEYRPNLGEVPRLALPENLPLNFLAEIRFDVAPTIKGVSSIAPSVSGTGSSNQSSFVPALMAPNGASATLPALEWNPTSTVKQPTSASASALSAALPSLPSVPAPSSSSFAASSVPVPPDLSSSSALIPIPPPIPPDAPSPSAGAMSSALVPVPPPLPDVLATDEKSGGDSSAGGGGGSSSSGGDAPVAPDASGSGGGGEEDSGGGGGGSGGLSLSDMIKHAAKKGLRKVADQVIEDNRAKKANTASNSSMDMLSQLKLRLQARHNVISGKSDRDERKQAAKEADEASASSDPTAPKIFRVPGSRIVPKKKEDEPAATPKAKQSMADVVIKAFVDKHQAKQNDEEAEEWAP